MKNHNLKFKITFIQTGGTIDKDYARTAKSYNFEFGEPAVKRILEKVNPEFNFNIITIFKKDSLDITRKDRNKILKTCKEIKNNKIIITHGTDTMVQTAKLLSQIKDKVIILAGASLPEKFFDSDASFNVGVAVGGVSVLENGIYIAMNGIIYPWYKVKKIKTGKFVKK